MLVSGSGPGARAAVGVTVVTGGRAVRVAARSAGAALRVPTVAVLLAVIVTVTVPVPHAALLSVLAGALAVGSGVWTPTRTVIVVTVGSRTVMSGLV